MEVRLCHFDRGEDKEWDKYVHCSPRSSFCHLSGWKRVIEKAYGHQGLYFWAIDQEKVKGIFPLVAMNTILFGKSLISLPYLDEGGICADGLEPTMRLYEMGRQLKEKMGMKTLEIRHNDESPLSLPLYGNKVSIRLPLTKSSDEQWNRLNAKVRNQVRKALKSGLTVHWENINSLSEFYEVFAINMRDLGSPVHSRQFFRIMFREYEQNMSLLMVRKDQKLISGGVCVRFKDGVYIPWASSLREFRPLCPNVLMYWEAIRWGCENQQAWFDFGRSTKGEGTYNFKMQWGSVEKPLHWQRVSTCIQDAAFPTEKARYDYLISLWSHLPVLVTKIVGPWIRKQVSL